MLDRQTLQTFAPGTLGVLLLASVIGLRLQSQEHTLPHARARHPAPTPTVADEPDKVSDPNALIPTPKSDGTSDDPSFAIATGLVQSPDGVAVSDARITIKGRDHLGRPVLRIGEHGGSLEHSSLARLQPIGELGVTEGPVPPITAAISGTAPTPFAPWTTRANGTFAAGGLPAGRYRIYVSHHTFAPVVSDEFVLLKGGSFALPAPLTLNKSGHLQVRILDLDGNPGTHAIVSLESDDLPLPWTSATNDDGLASFNNLAGTVFVEADVGEETLREQVEVLPGRSLDLVMRLTGVHSDAKLAGTVVDKLGHVVQGARIETSGPGPEHAQTRQTNERGFFSLSGMSTATITVKASHPTGGAVTKTLDYDAKFGLLNLVVHLPETALPVETVPDAGAKSPAGHDANTNDELAQQADATNTEATGEKQEGVAIEVERKGNGVGISWVAPGSRAAAAGLRRGQVIVAVDGADVLVPSQARSALRGKVGTAARVRIRSASGPKTLRVPREVFRTR